MAKCSSTRRKRTTRHSRKTCFPFPYHTIQRQLRTSTSRLKRGVISNKCQQKQRLSYPDHRDSNQEDHKDIDHNPENPDDGGSSQKEQTDIHQSLKVYNEPNSKQGDHVDSDSNRNAYEEEEPNPENDADTESDRNDYGETQSNKELLQKDTDKNTKGENNDDFNETDWFSSAESQKQQVDSLVQIAIENRWNFNDLLSELDKTFTTLDIHEQLYVELKYVDGYFNELVSVLEQYLQKNRPVTNNTHCVKIRNEVCVLEDVRGLERLFCNIGCQCIEICKIVVQCKEMGLRGSQNYQSLVFRVKEICLLSIDPSSYLTVNQNHFLKQLKSCILKWFESHITYVYIVLGPNPDFMCSNLQSVSDQDIINDINFIELKLIHSILTKKRKRMYRFQRGYKFYIPKYNGP